MHIEMIIITYIHSYITVKIPCIFHQFELNKANLIVLRVKSMLAPEILHDKQLSAEKESQFCFNLTNVSNDFDFQTSQTAQLVLHKPFCTQNIGTSEDRLNQMHRHSSRHCHRYSLLSFCLFCIDNNRIGNVN